MWYCSVCCFDVCSGCCWVLFYVSVCDYLDFVFWFWFWCNNDIGVDVYWFLGKFCVLGGGIFGDGTICWVFVGSLWVVVNG